MAHNNHSKALQSLWISHIPKILLSRKSENLSLESNAYIKHTGKLNFLNAVSSSTIQGTVDENLSQDTIPITVIEVLDSIESSDDILELLERFRADDVYSDQFGDNLVLQFPARQQHQTLISTLQAFLNFKKVVCASPASYSNLPSGPYLAIMGSTRLGDYMRMILTPSLFQLFQAV